MSLHRVLQSGGTTVVLLPPQRIPECTCNHTEIQKLLSGLMEFSWFNYLGHRGLNRQKKNKYGDPPHLPPPPHPVGWGSPAGVQPGAPLPGLQLSYCSSLSTSRIQRRRPGGRHHWSSDRRRTDPPEEDKGVAAQTGTGNQTFPCDQTRHQPDTDMTKMSTVSIKII